MNSIWKIEVDHASRIWDFAYENNVERYDLPIFSRRFSYRNQIKASDDPN